MDVREMKKRVFAYFPTRLSTGEWVLWTYYIKEYRWKTTYLRHLEDGPDVSRWPIEPRNTSNQAFQTHKEKVFADLEREEKEFITYLDKLREKQERKEFAAFKDERTK